MSFLKKRVSDRTVMYIALGILVLCLIPLYVLATYAAPYYDDYNYGLYVKVYNDGLMPEVVATSLLGTIKYNVNMFWWAWQGTYASTFFMSIMPASFGEAFYFIGPVMIITCITLGSFTLSYTLLRRVLGAERIPAVSVSAIVSAVLIELIFTAYQGLFWYNSSVHYTFMHGLMFFLLAALTELLYTKKKPLIVALTVISTVLSYTVAGANFTTALQVGCFMALILLFAIIARNKKAFAFAPVLLVYVYGVWHSFSAPGNNVRSEHFEGMGPVKAILMSFKSALTGIPAYSGLITIVILLVLAPILFSIVKKSKFSFRFPLLAVLLSFCLYATGFTPSYFAMGIPGMGRTLNVIKFTFQMLLIFDEAYVLGWIAKKTDGKPFQKIFEGTFLYYGVCVILLGICFLGTKERITAYSSYGAVREVFSGEAAGFRGEHEERLKLIEAANGGDVVLEPHKYRPWLLCETDELSEDPGAERNRSMAKFYYVNQIKISLNEGSH